jgi:hypothetical protein
MIQSMKKSKKGQITLFVILGLLIVGLLIFMFYPQLKDVIITTPDELIPTECIETSVVSALNITMIRGGSMNPQLYYRYNDEKIDYLCYTSEWYKTCVMQKPFLKQDIEFEIKNNASAAIIKCIDRMESQLVKKGYTVKTVGSKAPEIRLAPDKIIVSFNMSMNLEKGDQKMTFSPGRFQTEIKSNSYEIVMVASSIQNFEARFGDSVPESYMSFYPNIKVQKLKQADGTKIYIVEDRNTKEKLMFATRSLAWPPGFGFNPTFANPTEVITGSY